MKNFWIILLLLFGLSLSGCGSDGGISVSGLSAIMEGTAAVGDDIVEASIAKELAVMKTLMHRDKMLAKMYPASGFSMDWIIKQQNIIVSIPGSDPITVTVDTYLPKVAYREEPDFQQDLPTEPSVHPVWKTVQVIGTKLVDATLIGYGIHELANVWESSLTSAGDTTTTYDGTFTQSFNKAGANQTFSRDYVSTKEVITTTTTNPGIE